MKITVNGQDRQVEPGTTLEDLLGTLGLQEGEPFALAVNQNFVSKAHYAHTRVQDADRIDLVVPMQGG